MKKGREDGCQPSKNEKVLNNGKGGIDDKGCVSGDWKDEMINQRACEVLRWMLGRA